MHRKLSIIVVIISTLLLISMTQAGVDVTGPLDTVQGVPNEGISTDNSTNGWPPNELPPFICDDQVLTKFLHFAGDVEPTGVRITPAMGPTTVTGLTFTSANDAAERDPVEYELSGSNVSIDGPYTLIHAGPIVDFAGDDPIGRREKTTTPIQFANSVEYKHYQLIFPNVRDGAAQDSMQIAEIELLMDIVIASDPDPADGSAHEEVWATLGWTVGAFATSHDVYISDNYNDVKNGTEDAFKGNQTTNYFVIGFAGFPFPDGLVSGTTYYWRVDEVNPDNPSSPWVGDVWSFTVPPTTGWKPFPPNNGQFIDLETDLSWNPGWGAKMHTVYFGESFDDVNDAADGTAQIDAAYELETLDLGKTYYWRVDEFDGLQTFKGDIWSFTTTGGGGGIKGDYFGNTNLMGTPVLTRIDQKVDFDWAAESPGIPLQNDNWSVRWTADLNILLGDTYNFSVNSEGGTRLWIDGQRVLNMWVSWVATKYGSLPVYLDSGVHTLRLEFVDWDRNAVQQLYWSSPTMAEQIIPAGPLQPPLRAMMPNPANTSADVKDTQLLTWAASDKAASHQLYLGTDEEAVKNAVPGSPEDKGVVNLGDESFDPGLLERNTDYYWRVDEVNDLNPDSPWAGIVWTFKTADFLVIDDFEDYDIGNKEIWWFWKDGLGYGPHGDEPAYTGNGTGSAVGDETTGSYMEDSIVNGGTKSMPVVYDNSVAMYSEVEFTLGGANLTENGGTTLKIWYIGVASNVADPLYVALNGVIVENADAAAAQKGSWTEWDIPLQAFADKGVDVTNVNSITLGIGYKTAPQAGGTGTMYFDDIGVH